MNTVGDVLGHTIDSVLESIEKAMDGLEERIGRLELLLEENNELDGNAGEEDQ